MLNLPELRINTGRSDRQAMVKDKLTDLSRERLKKAIDKLIDVGLLEVAGNHIAGVRKCQFRLRLPIPTGSEPET